MTDANIVAWFDSTARPFLEGYAPERTATLVSEARRLSQLLDLPRETMVCCLGSAGVGKSTLINALVAGDRQVLPAGGVGPLTALATTVRYSDQRRFSAEYHKAKFLWKIVLPIHGACLRAQASADASAQQLETLFSALEAEGLTREDLTLAVNDIGSDSPESGTRLTEFTKMARQMVTGGQFLEAPNAYLVDCLRIALGSAPVFGSEPKEDDLLRLHRLRAALTLAERGQTYVREENGDLREFLRDIEDHAAKNLAPIIAKIEVGWPSELLRSGVVIVDLPGVGVASDIYRNLTQQYVREQARAVLLVVDRAGVTDAVLDSIRSSGYWDRLVGAAYDPEADPCALLVAVTKVDEVAEEEFAKYRDLPKEDRPKKADVFADKIAEMETGIRQQTAQQLSQIHQSSNADVAEARALARDQLLGQLRVFPVSAPDFRRIVADDDDDRPHVARSREDTRVPHLADAIEQIAHRLHVRHQEAIASVRDRLLRGVHGELAIIENQWQGEQRVAEEAERLRRDLDAVVRPWREELANRQGGFREFLQDAVRDRIQTLVVEARDAAEEDIRKYLKRLRDCHWATLRATVRRGGTWVGSRQIDLPADISDLFQDPMAAVWGMRLLKDVRKRTQEYAQDCGTFVGYVVAWAREQGGRVNPAILERQEQRIADQGEQIRQVGREAADELRAVVKSELQRAISPPIRRRCEKFVDDGEDIGPGVKQRILELFDDLARQSARSAEPPARRILEKRFEEVREQIDEAFAQWNDPLQETVDAIAVSNEQRMRRADSKKRARVLAEAAMVRESSPVMPAPVVTDESLGMATAG